MKKTSISVSQWKWHQRKLINCMLLAECINLAVTQQMHKGHVSAVANQDTLLLTVGVKRWIVTIVGKKAMLSGYAQTKNAKTKAQILEVKKRH